jgi:hypothetical protein
MIRIGIDPGKNGFICKYVSNIDYESFKYDQIPLINKEVDLHTLNDILDIDHIAAKNNVHCVIEDVHAIFGSAAKATFNFGYVVGVLEALLVSHNIPYTKVKPKEWQKEMWQGIPLQKKPNGRTDTKAMSLLAAKRLFPNEDLTATERSVKPHDGKVDALLLAEYCRRKF